MQTPAGLFPKSNVHAVPTGARVHQSPTEVQIIGSNGTVLHSVPITGSKTPGAPFRRPTSTSTNRRRELSSGYVGYAYWENFGSSPISFFATSWTVPPVPSNVDGQLLYWFNALVPDSDDAILQPVLQFGLSPAGGGAYYGVASWYLLNSNIYHTGLVQVEPGQGLAGYMTLTSVALSGSTPTYTWSTTFVDIPSTTLFITTTEELTLAYEALEIYNAETAADLPSGSTEFTQINIVTQDQENPSITWTALSDPADGISMSVVSSSSTNGALQVAY